MKKNNFLFQDNVEVDRKLTDILLHNLTFHNPICSDYRSISLRGITEKSQVAISR